MPLGTTILAALLGLVLSALSAGAETRGLLVGVAEYDVSADMPDLKGPPNDVRRMRQVLGDLGVTDLTVLAHWVEGAGLPTRAAILDAFHTLAAQSRNGDQVFLFLAGHGSRQDDLNGDEADGLDEVFLPADVRPGPLGSGQIENAILDDEIGQAVDRIRAKGADVILVMDSCHSGTGLRAGAKGATARYVDPAAFGLTLAQRALAEAPWSEPLDKDLPGGVLAIYATRATELAHEDDFAPKGEPPHIMGAFTLSLARHLAEARAPNYQTLLQAVQRDVADLGRAHGFRQTPEWQSEGDILAAPVLGRGVSQSVRRLGVEDRRLKAGRLQGLSKGTLLALFAEATDPEDAPLAYAQIARLRTASAVLTPVAADCQPRPDALCDKVGRLPREARFAQVLARPFSLTVGIAAPRDLATGAPLPSESAPYQALSAALVKANATGAMDFAMPAEAPLVQVMWDGARFWFGPEAEIAGHPAGLAWDPASEDPLPLLARIAAAEEIVATLSALMEAPPRRPAPVEIGTVFSPWPVEALWPEGASPREECPTTGPNAQSQPLPPHAEIKHCDHLRFSAKSQSANRHDINRVFIATDYCLYVDHHQFDGPFDAPQFGRDVTFWSDVPSYAAGRERFFTIVSKHDSGPALNLRQTLPTCDGAGALRGSAMRAFLADMARRPDLRSGSRRSEFWITRHDLTLLPRRVAFERFGRLE